MSASKVLRTSTTFKNVTHVLFDMDGLLIDTEEIYAEVVRDICLKYNKRCTKEVRMKILGTTEQRTAQIVVQDMKLSIDASEFRRQYSELAQLRLHNAPLLEGAERLLRHLYMNKVPIAVATSSGEECVVIKIQNYKELFGLVNHIVMGSTDSEVKEGKPAPDIFLVCASRFPDKPDPEQCLVFEDAPNGVLAAVSAGMQVVMVPDTKLTTEQKLRATLVITSLLDFKPEAFGLPPFPSKEQVAIEE